MAGYPDDEVTSDYASSIGESEFTTIKTHRLVNLYEHGRRYQGIVTDRYGLPNDEAEQLREGIKHRLYLDYILHGHYFIAPIGDSPQKIVDLGTGTGLWAFEVAEKFPSARVIGTDISAIQPSWAPPNLEFRVEDLEDDHRPWTTIYDSADLIHCRFLVQVIRNPRKLIANIFEKLKPGGWIECHDIFPTAYSDDGTTDPQHPVNELYTVVAGPFTALYSWSLHVVADLPDLLHEAGFINIVQKKNKIPLGRWHKNPKMREAGMFHQAIFMDFAIAVLAKREALGLDDEEANALGQRLLDACNNPEIHAYCDWADTYAQKPPA
ncbi:hypothetical protein K4F52_006324 [Lecanicillium sp. MT-2017a]|nr:hypothetical protein K4F52_006324 [Lecanicillium sp. MT-2017a]